MCFVDMKKALESSKKMMGLCEGTKTKVRVVSAYSEEFEVKFGVLQGSALLPLLFA